MVAVWYGCFRVYLFVWLFINYVWKSAHKAENGEETKTITGMRTDSQTYVHSHMQVH